MQQSLITLNLPEHKIKELRNMGYSYCEDVTNNLISSSSGTSQEEWQTLTANTKTKTALELLKEEDESCYIRTSCSAIDDILDYGVPVNAITEICGAPGSGKTQLCLQLCVSVQMPDCFGGLDGHAVYIDTTSGFTVTRLEEIAKGRLNHCRLVASKHNSYEMLKKLNTFTENTILNGVHYLQITRYEEFIATLNLLKTFISQDPKIKLLAIDNITEPVKNSNLDLFKKVQILYSFLSDLQKMAIEKSFAVVLTNDLTCKMDEFGCSYLVPSLGDLYGHRIVYRMMLERIGENEYVAKLIKSVLKPYSEAHFRITREGIVDLE